MKLFFFRADQYVPIERNQSIKIMIQNNNLLAYQNHVNNEFEKLVL